MISDSCSQISAGLQYCSNVKKQVLLCSVTLSISCGNGGFDVTTIHVDPPLQPQRVFAAPVRHPLDISSTFGPRWKASANRYDFHPGIDWYDAAGTPVLAIGDGIVEDVYPEASSTFPLGGNVVIVRHLLQTVSQFQQQPLDRIFAVYQHLQSISVKPGDAVGRGQTVGTMGKTGDTDFVHLHFEIRAQSVCSLQFQAANPASTCGHGYDPHVHPLLFIPFENQNQVILDQVSTSPNDALTLRYVAQRSDLDLDVVASDQLAIGFDQRLGMDATTLTRLDNFVYPGLTLTPEPFASSSDSMAVLLHFTKQPRFVDVTDLDGNGLRITP
jgi:murein DD-endopeptidase MepM/ murein hydrolase activator NlpD